jgi:hypothetical protein
VCRGCRAGRGHNSAVGLQSAEPAEGAFDIASESKGQYGDDALHRVAIERAFKGVIELTFHG